jgi:hypothetical protein
LYVLQSFGEFVNGDVLQAWLRPMQSWFLTCALTAR